MCNVWNAQNLIISGYNEIMSFVFGIFKFSESHVKCCAIMSGYRRAPAYSGRDRQQLLPSNELFFFWGDEQWSTCHVPNLSLMWMSGYFSATARTTSDPRRTQCNFENLILQHILCLCIARWYYCVDFWKIHLGLCLMPSCVASFQETTTPGRAAGQHHRVKFPLVL